MERCFATLESDAFEHPVEIVHYEGYERLGQPFRYTLKVVCKQGLLEPEKIISNDATLSFVDQDEQPLRKVHGLLAQCDDSLDTESSSPVYLLTLVPRLWRAKLVQLIDIHLDITLPDLLRKKLLALHMVEGLDFELRLQGDYPEREFIVQYQETDLHFISRLCEHLGVTYFFEFRNDRSVLVFSDHNDGFGPIAPNGEAPFHARGEQLGIFELTRTSRMIPTRYVQRDYNYRIPGVDLSAYADAPDAHGGGIYEYGAHFKDEDEGEALALIRAQERGCGKRLFQGKSVLPTLTAGSTFVLQGHPYGNVNMLITEISFRGSQGWTSDKGEEDNARHRNEFTAISMRNVYRPPRVTKKPKVDGLLTGLIEGPEDQYAQVDEQGRYLVRFLFDTAPHGERQASRPIRMMQPHAGPGYGMHFPLRGGVEVLIGFVNGDPDRPIIAGTVPNPRTPSPVSMPNRERNIIRTGGGNEINIDDLEGKQRIKISTPRSDAEIQLGSPNANEDGVWLSSTSNLSVSTSATANWSSIFSNHWSAFDGTWGNHLIDFAGALTPMQKIGGSLSLIDHQLSMIKSALDLHLQIEDAQLAKKEAAAEEAAAVWAVKQEPGAERATALAALEACAASHDECDVSALTSAAEDYDNAVQASEDNYADSRAYRDKINELDERYKQAKEAGEEALAQAAVDELKELQAEGDPKDENLFQGVANADRAIRVAAGNADCAECTSAIEAFTAAQAEYDGAYDKFHQTRKSHTSKLDQVDDGSYKSVKSVSDHIGAVQSQVTGGIVGPLYSLLTTLFGAGIKGYAVNVVNKLREYATHQYLAAEPRYALPEVGWGLDFTSIAKLATLQKIAPAEPTPKEIHNKSLGVASRTAWHKVLTPDDEEFMPGGGAGGIWGAADKPLQRAAIIAALTAAPISGPILAAYFQSAFGKAFSQSRNIEGSEDHTAIFAKKQVFVAGGEDAVVSGTHNAVVTAEQSAVLHARGAAEVSGEGQVLISSSRLVDLLSRGRLVAACSEDAHKNVGDANEDKLRTELSMDKHGARLRAFKTEVEQQPFEGYDERTGGFGPPIRPSSDPIVEEGRERIQNKLSAMLSVTRNPDDQEGSIDGYATQYVAMTAELNGNKTQMKLTSDQTAMLLAGDDVSFTMYGQKKVARLSAQKSHLVLTPKAAIVACEKSRLTLQADKAHLMAPKEAQLQGGKSAVKVGKKIELSSPIVAIKGVIQNENLFVKGSFAPQNQLITAADLNTAVADTKQEMTEKLNELKQNRKRGFLGLW